MFMIFPQANSGAQVKAMISVFCAHVFGGNGYYMVVTAYPASLQDVTAFIVEPVLPFFQGTVF